MRASKQQEKFTAKKSGHGGFNGGSHGISSQNRADSPVTVEGGVDSKIYHFHVLGVPYKLKTSHDDQTVVRLVEYVNQLMKQSVSVTKNGSFQNAAVLTALNLAEEIILLKQKTAIELDRLEEKAMQIANDLESHRDSQRESHRDSRNEHSRDL